VAAVVQQGSNNQFIIVREGSGSSSSSLEGVLDLTDGFTNIILVSLLSVHSHQLSNSCKIFLRNTFSRERLCVVLIRLRLLLLGFRFLDRSFFNNWGFNDSSHNRLRLSLDRSRSRLGSFLDRSLGTFSWSYSLHNFLRRFRGRAFLSRSSFFGASFSRSYDYDGGCNLCGLVCLDLSLVLGLA
jgi:hypothetical protein